MTSKCNSVNIIADGSPSKRWGHCGVCFEGNLIIFGGRDNDDDCNDLFCYDPSSIKWTMLIQESTKFAPVPRRRAICGIVQKALIIFGGFTKNSYVADYSLGRLSIPANINDNSLARDYAKLINNKDFYDIQLKVKGNIYYLQKPLILYRRTDKERNESKLIQEIAEIKPMSCLDVTSYIDSIPECELILECFYTGTVVSLISSSKLNGLINILVSLELVDTANSLKANIESIMKWEKIHPNKKVSLLKFHTQIDNPSIYKNLEYRTKDLYYIKAGDITFQCCKAILFARSKYFRNLIKYQNEHISPFVDPELIKYTLQYYYTGNINLPNDLKEDIKFLILLSISANFYMEERLSVLCCQYIQSLVSYENVVFLIAFAYIYNDKYLLVNSLETAIIKGIPIYDLCKSIIHERMQVEIGDSILEYTRQILNSKWPIKGTTHIVRRNIEFYEDYLPSKYLICKENIANLQMCDEKKKAEEATLEYHNINEQLI